jgi:hypothetical protein
MNNSLDGGAPEMGNWGSKIDSTGSSGLKTGHEQGCPAILHPVCIRSSGLSLALPMIDLRP